jgi:hypothetical protein
MFKLQQCKKAIYAGIFEAGGSAAAALELEAADIEERTHPFLRSVNVWRIDWHGVPPRCGTRDSYCPSARWSSEARLAVHDHLLSAPSVSTSLYSRFRSGWTTNSIVIASGAKQSRAVVARSVEIASSRKALLAMTADQFSRNLLQPGNDVALSTVVTLEFSLRWLSEPSAGCFKHPSFVKSDSGDEIAIRIHFLRKPV